MGYDIELYSLKDFNEAKIENGQSGDDNALHGKYQTVFETYLSYNFSGMAKV